MNNSSFKTEIYIIILLVLPRPKVILSKRSKKKASSPFHSSGAELPPLISQCSPKLTSVQKGLMDFKFFKNLLVYR